MWDALCEGMACALPPHVDFCDRQGPLMLFFSVLFVLGRCCAAFSLSRPAIFPLRPPCLRAPTRLSPHARNRTHAPHPYILALMCTLSCKVRLDTASTRHHQTIYLTPTTERGRGEEQASRRPSQR